MSKLTYQMALFICFLGLVFCGVGELIEEQHKIIGKIFIYTGGAILGASISALVSCFLTKHLEENIKQIVKEGYENGLDLDEKNVSPHRRTYYVYHATSSDGKPMWRLAVLDFESSIAYGKLITKATAKKNEKLYDYTYKGYLKNKGKKLVLCSTKNDDPSGVYIFPEFADENENYSSGIASLETWDPHWSAFSQCIISKNPLTPADGKQNKNTVEFLTLERSNDMNKLWGERAKKLHYHILPSYDLKELS